MVKINKKILLTRVLPALVLVMVALGALIFIEGKKKVEQPVEEPVQEEQEIVLPAINNMNTEESATEVCDELSQAGLSNVDTFKEWVVDFGKSAGENAGLCSEWSEPYSEEIDLFECMDGWESNHDYSDSDCRITAYLLLKGLITAEYPDTYYNGTYLMFDIDAMEGTNKYDLIKEDQDLFNTIFGERYMSWGQDLETTYAKTWEEKGIKINSDKVSLLCLSILDETSREAFVGHAGVLVEQEEGLLFVEKIAFQQPYQATKVKDLDELMDILAQRPEYFGQEGTESENPCVFVNGEFKGRLKNPAALPADEEEQE